MALVLLNPHAQGGRLGRRQAEISRALNDLDPSSRLMAPRELGEAKALLMGCGGGERVVAIGGDGTVNRWLPALRARNLELGLVPMGSGNDLARALGLYGMPWRDALGHALRGSAISMDVGLVRWGRDSAGEGLVSEPAQARQGRSPQRHPDLRSAPASG